MSLKLKTADTDTTVRDDGATRVGIMVGAIVGACLVYWRLALTTHPHSVVIVISVSAGTFLGAFIGWRLGRQIDKRLAPRVEQIIDNAPTEQKPTIRGRMHDGSSR